MGERRAHHGENAETNGIPGRVYKDKFAESELENPTIASVYLDRVIEAYIRIFECEPADDSPGVNAINLLILKGALDALLEIEHLAPAVSFAVVPRLQSRDGETLPQ
ncbi:TRAFs-binding domain-containing protein [Rhodopirellula sp. MGV]|uniref:TRAFs-binding domain-containing protein n=1 Tax=Rhodopirellula sp. MGV TaxID=2023130 RepID=UPI000CD09F80|nr:TRAFs-binding domain-containing protein [Rhodopirellula sp. MGV]PNY37745.1 hypothetical protein C2E31_06315 [Rhodopirellula baltica]